MDYELRKRPLIVSTITHLKISNTHLGRKPKQLKVRCHLAYKSSAQFWLESICRYRARREIFLADHRFSIALDSTDFGHWVGEVEPQTQQTASALSDIDTFMQKHSWFLASYPGQHEVVRILISLLISSTLSVS
jgi:hypothetical protein